jgi:PAS domain S-box-containing protein
MHNCHKTSSQLVEKNPRKLSFRPGKMFKTIRLKQAFRFKLWMLIVVFTFICLFADTKAKGDERKRILVINSYHPTYVWTKEMIKGIESTLSDYDPSIELDIEYMDAKRIKSEEHYENFYNLYKHKSTIYDSIGKHPGVIIACDDPALLFINKHRDEFINDPIVFCGINADYESIRSLLQEYPSMTGILETANYKTTLQMALEFHSKARQVVVIYNERSPLYNLYKTELRNARQQLSDKLEFMEFSMWEISKGEPLKTIENLGDESIVLLLSGLLDPRGDLYPLPDGIVTLQKRCFAPIYTASREWIELDLAVGGDITSAFHQGAAAVQMAIRIINGEKPVDIPVIKKSPSIFTLSYPEMIRFGISPSKLPEEAIILNQPESFYRKYHTQIYTISLIVAGLSAATILLSVNIIRRIKAEQGLKKARDELELRVHKRTAELAEANLELRSENYKRKRAEDNLAKERNLLRTLIDNIPDFVYIKDAESRFILNNKAHQRAIGVTSQEELTGKTDLDVFPKDLARGYYADEREIIRTGKALVNREEMFKNADGKDLWVLATKIPLRDDSGKITTLIGISRDITKQKQATDALQKHREQLRSTLESTADGILAVDENQKIIYFNTQFTEMWHVPQTLVEGRDDKKLLDFVLNQLAEPQAFLSKVYQLYSSHKSSFDTLFFKDGRVLERFSRPLIQDGKLAGRVWSFRNVTERKQTERKIFEYQENLQSLASELSLAEERLRHQIAVNVHDNIGQHLAISKIKIESLAKLLSSPKHAEMLKEVRELINQAIENTRSISFELSPPVLYELGFESAIEWLARRTKERDGLSVKFVDDKRKKPLDETVRVFLFQAVRELLVNIVKHARAKEVKVSVRKVDRRINVSVEDDGRGFDVSKVKRRKYKTGGFGLFSIQERLKYIGGDIDIDTAPNQGTRITLAAPINTQKNKERSK